MRVETAPDGVALIAAERARQVAVEGWTPEHDATHKFGELSRAAMAYTHRAAHQVQGIPNRAALAAFWPWAHSWWKPSSDPIRNLVKAGALIAAEIDRLKRAELRDVAAPEATVATAAKHGGSARKGGGMSAIELFHRDGKAAGVWYCSECRAVHAHEISAVQCHGVALCSCGQPVKQRFYTQCAACDSAASLARDRKKEAERFEAAAKIAAAEYGGPVYVDGVGQEWFETLDEYLEHVEDEFGDIENPPKYVWAAKNISVRKVTTEDVTESLLDGMWEDADESDLDGIAELQAALDAFNLANESVTVWNVDYTRAIVLETRKAAA